LLTNKEKYVPILAIVAVFVVLAMAPIAAAAPQQCVAGENGYARCDSTTASVPGQAAGQPTPKTEYVEAASCGPRVRTPSDTHIHDDGCFEASITCLLRAGEQAKPDTQVVEYSVYSTATHEYLRTEIACEVPLASAVPSILAVKEEVTKRAPRLYAATGGVEFPVNAAVVFHLSPDRPRPVDEAGYAEAAPDVSIPPFSLGGHAFRVQLKLVRTQWNWDDTSTAPRGWAQQQSVFTAADPAGAQGMVYDQQRRPCESNLQCRRYLSHAWYRVGPARVTVRTYWAGSFSIDGGVAIPIPGEIFTDSPSPKILNLKSYRTVLLDPDIDPNYRPGD